MTGSVGAYVAQVDRVLGAGEGLFPASGGPGGVDGGGGPAVPAAPPGAQLSSGAGGAGDDYQRRWDGVRGTDDQTNGAAGEGSAEGQQGRAGATGVRQSARAQAAAIAPATGSPAGVKLLVSTMDERLAAMQRQIGTTKAQNRVLALRLRQLAGVYRMAGAAAPMGMGGGIGMPTGGGPGSGMGGLGAMPGLGALGSSFGSLGGSRSGGGADPGGALEGLFGRDGRGSDAAARAVAFAKTKLGSPYVWGASGPRAYDCSGLVEDSYRHAGIALPRTTYALAHVGTPVSCNSIREGDLILSNFSSNGPEHVQLAVSPTMVIEAPTPGGHVQFSSIPSGRIAVRRIA